MTKAKSVNRNVVLASGGDLVGHNSAIEGRTAETTKLKNVNRFNKAKIQCEEIRLRYLMS